jgi:ankyrin repeat protein
LGGRTEIVEILTKAAEEQAAKQDEVTKVLLDALNAETLAKSLLSAVKRGDKGLAKQILDHRADVNTQDNFGVTPLHYAAAKKGKKKLL